MLLIQLYRLRHKIIIFLIIVFNLIWIRNITISYHNQSQLQLQGILSLSNKTAYDDNVNNIIHKNLQCYVHHDIGGESERFLIDDILSNERKPNKGNSIFFHETSCSKTGQIKLNARQACAIESAASLNPNLDIFVLFSSPVTSSNQNKTQTDVNIQEALKLYKNIYFRNVDIWSYADDTPINEWLLTGKIFYSKTFQSHMSNILRYLTLWRWGGTHLDLDIILKKSLEKIKPNFVGIQDDKYIANAVLNLDYDDLGHKIANMLLKHCETEYNPDIYACLGTVLITKVFSKICKTNLVPLMTTANCSDFKIYDKTTFHTVHWSKAVYFFNKIYLNKTLNMTKDSIAIHVWNKISKNFIVKVGSNVPYDFYAKRYCPKVHSSCGEYF